jgi:hypothetical protein
MTSVQITALIGAISDGFSTIVQPAAMAGATLQTIWLIGQFHGVIMPITPMGSLAIRVEPCIHSKRKPSKSWIIRSRCSVPIGACAERAKASGAPISRDSACATSSCRLRYSSRMARSRSSRCLRLVRENESKARRAAATARSTSAALPTAIWVNASSVEGSITSSKAGAAGSTQAPSM